MTDREKAICELFTGICFCAGEKRGEVYKYAEELLGRPAMTHDFLLCSAELREKARPDFVAICQDKYQKTTGWIKNDIEIAIELTCPVCGFMYVEADPTIKKGYNYCPECGAKNE